MDWDTENSSGVECPYCGGLDEDEPPRQSGQYSCDDCGKTSYLEVEFSVTYYSTKPESELAEHLKRIEYWKNPAPEHEEHAAAILADYERRAEVLKVRIAKNDQVAVNQ